MDLKRDRIFKDLLHLHFERSAKATESLAEMCSMSGIPEYETKAGAAANYLLLFMALTSETKPGLTPHELGQIMESQYNFFIGATKDAR